MKIKEYLNACNVTILITVTVIILMLQKHEKQDVIKNLNCNVE